eukprot:TRINITY_DN1646_c0_g1_i1.p2 TRINITY_DN1646_c0_g1~~TRINITY_DN1646_c0_g1_i1.p2  ORF type:complete len:114 (-),score=14.75 TRINITY_DN1646_c0_g1_i1:543-884(-)
MVCSSWRIVQVSFEQLTTTTTSLTIFDVLKNEDLEGGAIVQGEDGRIMGCFEEWEEGMCLQDRWMDACLGTEHVELWSADFGWRWRNLMQRTTQSSLSSSGRSSLLKSSGICV